MHGDPQLWFALMDRLTDLAIAFLDAQIDAGARAVQLFDSWAGALHPADYRRFAQPASTRVLCHVRARGVPTIHFGVNTGELLPLMRDAGADVVGVDWRTHLDAARARLGNDVALQGNLDPAILMAPWPVVEAEVRDVLARNAGHPGHVFNLGHGVLPETEPSVLERVVELVHREGVVALAP
jgi:uroporphyrinogen decarboxylase